MFRIKGDPIIKNKIPYHTGASTGGNISSSDIGSLIISSSGRGALVHASTDSFALTNAGGNLPVTGILSGITDSTATTVSDETNKIWVQPIAPGEILEADYTTDTNFWTQANEYLVSSNVGNFLRLCGQGSSSSIGSTALSSIQVGSSDAFPLVQSQYIDVSTGGTAGGSSYPFQMLGYSTRFKTVDVVFRSGSTVELLTPY